MSASFYGHESYSLPYLMLCLTFILNNTNVNFSIQSLICAMWKDGIALLACNIAGSSQHCEGARAEQLVELQAASAMPECPDSMFVSLHCSAEATRRRSAVATWMSQSRTMSKKSPPPVVWDTSKQSESQAWWTVGILFIWNQILSYELN
jgi:hypothetical protein